MTQFMKMRVSTMVWGFLVLYAFTGRLDLTSLVFLIQVAGNTALMWWYTR